MKRKKVLSASFVSMFTGFLVSIFGIFQSRVDADVALGTSGGQIVIWLAVIIAGLVFVLVGFLGIIFAVASSNK